MLVATSRLVMSMTGQSQTEHWKIVKDAKLEVGTLVPYAKYVDESRNITELSDETIDELVDGLTDYLIEGKTRKL